MKVKRTFTVRITADGSVENENEMLSKEEGAKILVNMIKRKLDVSDAVVESVQDNIEYEDKNIPDMFHEQTMYRFQRVE